jgi:NitT/TauT family transport system permease protein
MKRIIIASVFFLVLLLIWQAMVLSRHWSPVLLPSPFSVVDYLQSAAADGSLLEATEVTLRRLLIGYAIGIAIGLPLGLLSSSFTFFADTMGVLALGLQTLPSVCWIPPALLWFR